MDFPCRFYYIPSLLRNYCPALSLLFARWPLVCIQAMQPFLKSSLFLSWGIWVPEVGIAFTELAMGFAA